MLVWNSIQEEETQQICLKFENVPPIPPLSEAITYDEYEQKQRKIQEEYELIKKQEEKRLDLERAACNNSTIRNET